MSSAEEANAPPDLVSARPLASAAASGLLPRSHSATPTRAPQAFPCAAFALAFHPTADVLAVGLVSGSIQLFRYGPGVAAPALSLPLHAGAVRALAFAPGGDGSLNRGMRGARER